jgi:hypothetical protein
MQSNCLQGFVSMLLQSAGTLQVGAPWPMPGLEIKLIPKMETTSNKLGINTQYKKLECFFMIFPIIQSPF